MQHDWFTISATTLTLTVLYGISALWVMRKGSRPKLWLIVLMATALTYILSLALLSVRQPAFLEKLMFSYSLLGFFGAGLLLVYCRSLMFPWKSVRAIIIRLLSLIGALVVLYIGLSVFYKPALPLHTFGHIIEQADHPVVFLRIATFMALVAFFVYVCLQIIWMHRRHQACIADQFSFREGVSLSLLPYLVGFFIVYGIVGVLHILFIDLMWVYVAANFIYTGFYLCMSIMGLRQQDIYTKAEIILNKTAPLSATHIISADIHCRLAQQLTELMLQNHAYRNPELRIDEAARAVNTNRTYLSSIIRDHFETHFIGFVNKYRIAEAKELLSDDNSLTIVEIADKVGFKSVTSFNLFFRKETGVSPSQFRRTQS
jgi:AraC-like DNA-binding protein